jgi:hypothetical protein
MEFILLLRFLQLKKHGMVRPHTHDPSRQPGRAPSCRHQAPQVARVTSSGSGLQPGSCPLRILIPLPFYFPILQHVFLALPGCGLARKMLDILAPTLELAVLPALVHKILSLTLIF